MQIINSYGLLPFEAARHRGAHGTETRTRVSHLMGVERFTLGLARIVYIFGFSTDLMYLKQPIPAYSCFLPPLLFCTLQSDGHYYYY
jgi:hypothetical protein